MSIRFKEGDLLEAKEGIIAHQVNCMGAAGGLAAAVFEKWPEAGREYKNLVHAMADKDKPEELLGGCHLSVTPDYRLIADLFGQYYPGADYRPYALREALRQLASIAYQLDESVALPYKISCGICGGDWDEVLKIIEEEMNLVDCVIYKRPGD